MQSLSWTNTNITWEDLTGWLINDLKCKDKYSYTIVEGATLNTGRDNYFWITGLHWHDSPEKCLEDYKIFGLNHCDGGFLFKKDLSEISILQKVY